MFLRKIFIVHVLILVLSQNFVEGSFWDFFRPKKDVETELKTFPNVPYELSERDETFIQEAKSLLGTSFTELDMCHQRVVLALKKTCNNLNSEQLGKLSVMLLNCQFDAEGRVTFDCTETMSLKQCTENMNSDTWNSYLTVMNSARAVCQLVRNEQFRGLTEIAVNKLMTTTREQIEIMEKLKNEQKSLHEVTSHSIDELAETNLKFVREQEELIRLTEANRFQIENNFNSLIREKNLIETGQRDLLMFLTKLTGKIDESMKLMEVQTEQSKVGHAGLMNEMTEVEQSFRNIIEDLKKSTEDISKKIQEINGTVYGLADVLVNFQLGLDEKVNWISHKVGGEKIFNRVNLVMIYGVYLMFGMLSLSFVNASTFSRIVLVVCVPANFLANYFEFYGLDFIAFSSVLFTILIGNFLINLIPKSYISKLFKNNDKPAINPQNGVHPPHRPSLNIQQPDDEDYISRIRRRQEFLNLSVGDIKQRSRTPSFFDDRSEVGSRSGTPFSSTLVNRNRCTALTVKGDVCRNAALADGELCRVHCRNYD